MSLKTKKAIAEGRGFNTGTLNDGMMKQLKTFLTSVDVGWYLLLDNSGDGTDPHFFISNKNTNVDNDNTQIFYKIGFLTSESGYIRISTYYKWDGSITFSIPGWYKKVTTYDTAEFEFQCRADTELEFIALTTLPGSTAYTAIASVLKMDDSYLPTGYAILQTISAKVMGVDNYIATLTVSDASAFLVGSIYILTDTKTANTSIPVVVQSKDVGLNKIVVTSPGNITLNVTLDASAQIGALPHKFVLSDGEYCATPYNIQWTSGYTGFLNYELNTNNQPYNNKTEGVSSDLSNIPTMIRPMVVAYRALGSNNPVLADTYYLGHIPYLFKSVTRTAFVQGFTVDAVNYVSIGGLYSLEEGAYV